MLAVLGLHQRVDLDEEGVLLDEGGPQGHQDLGDLLGDLGRELRRGDDLGGLLDVTPSLASTGTLASASGFFSATSSISMPPSTDAMARKVRLVRSRRKET